MKYLIVFVFLFLQTVTWAATTTNYDFSNRTPEFNAFAFGGLLGSKVPSNKTSPSFNYSGSDYDQIKVNDGNYRDSYTTSKNRYPSIRYVFELDEDVNTVNDLTIFWNGFGQNSKRNKLDGVQIYIWNNASGSYSLIAENTSSATVNLTGSVSSAITNYIDNDKRVTIFIVSQEKTFNREYNWIGTDYFRLQVTADKATTPASIVANYQFDQCNYTGNGNEVVDQTGNHSGSIFGITEPSSTAVINNSLDLSATGIDDWVSLPNETVDGLNDFSVSVWINTSIAKRQQEIIHVLGRGLSNGFGFDDDMLEIYLSNSSTVYVKVQDSGQQLSAGKNITDGQWHHLVVTREDNRVCLYVDGALQPCGNGVNSGVLSLPNNDAVVVGQEQDSYQGDFDPDQSFEGYIDELMIYDGKLTSAEISTLYDRQSNGKNYDGITRDTVSCGFIIANFQFDECSYTGRTGEVIDQLGNNNATSYNNTNTSVDAQIEKALAITNAQHHIQTNILLPNTFSVSTWFKKPTDNLGNKYFILGAMEGGGDLLYLDRDNGWRWGIYDASSANSVDGSYSFSRLDNNWHHMALVYQNRKSHLYIDGVFVETINLAPSGTLKYIGTSLDDFDTSTPQGFRAPLDEFIVFDGALTVNEIATIYNNQNMRKNYDGTSRAPSQCNNELIAQFSMEQMTWNGSVGEIIDETGNFNARARNGALTANTLSAINGNPGTCRYGSFDGDNDYIELPSSFENLQSSFTIAAWIKPRNIDSGSRIFADDENNQTGYAFSLGDQNSNKGHLRFYSRGVRPVSLDTAAGVISPDAWVFVTAVHNSATKSRQIYVDGSLKASGTYTGSWGTDTGPASIGGETDSGETNNRFTGDIDEVHVFKGALTAAEIYVLRSKTHPCAEPAIHHYEIVHDGNGLTCAAEPITIKACTNSSCSSNSDLSTESVSLDFTVFSPTDGTSIKFTPTFTGSTSFNFNHTKAETLTLSIDGATVSASNPIECSGFGSSCEMTFSEAGYILTLDDHNACTTPDLVIQAVKLSDDGMSCAPAYTGNQPVDVTFNYSSPVTGSRRPILNNIVMEESGIAERRTLDFGSSATVTLPFQYNDAGRINIAVSEGSNAGLTSGHVTTIVSPDKLIVSAPEVNSACVSADPNDELACKKFKLAGESFTLNIAAACADESADETIYTPNFELNDIALTVNTIAPDLGNPVILGKRNFNFLEATGETKDGIIQLADQTISEVGVFTITATPPVYGYFNKKTIPAATSENIGRFVPKHFTVNSVFEGELGNSNGSSFAYTGEMNNLALTEGAISYKNAMEPEMLITAQNVGGQTTRNYTGSFMKLNQASFTVPAIALDVSRLEKILDTDVVSNINILTSNLSDEGDGTVKYKFSATDNFIYTRNEKSLINKYTADIDLQINSIIDSDDVAADDTDSDGRNGILILDPKGIEIGFGRWNIENTYGPETADLPLPMTVQYWDGSQFVVNDLDSLTAYDGSVASNYTKSNAGLSPQLAIGVVNVSDAGPMFNLGLGQLLLSRPTDGSQGQIRVIYETVPDWLKFNWNSIDENSDDNIFDDSPSGVATFGLYRGNDRIISWREVSN
jgi:MSHA biogenesis protein MshQ